MIFGNNPGNLKYDDRFQWQGLATPPKDDKGFCVFLTAEAGLRALAIDLRNQQVLHGLDTPESVISKFAPERDNNDVPAYVAAVYKRTGFTPNETIDLTDRQTLKSFMTAVIWQENGSCPYSAAQIADAVLLALPFKSDKTSMPKQAAPAPSSPPATIQGAAAAAGSSGLLIVIAQAELKRRNINMDPQELIAIATLLAPILHTAARVIQAISRTLVQKYAGIDIDDGNGHSPLLNGAKS